jgi:hypothetical protein
MDLRCDAYCTITALSNALGPTAMAHGCEPALWITKQDNALRYPSRLQNTGLDKLRKFPIYSLKKNEIEWVP